MSKLSALLKTAFRVTGKKVLHRPRTGGELSAGDWSAALEKVRQTGLAVIPGFWTSEQCQKAQADFDALIANPRAGVWRDETASDERIFGFEDHSEIGREYMADEEIRTIKRDYYGADPDELEEFAMMNKVVYRPGNLGSGGGWHRDAVHEQQLKTILYLSDVTAETGAFQYLLNTHEKSSIYKTIRENNIGYAQFRFTEEEITDILAKHGDQYPRQTATGLAGTLVIADTSGIHRGSPIMEGTRYAITQYIFRKSTIGGKGIPAHIRKNLGR